ncbi:MAG: PilZ domain-containing protein [Pirellulaceae bacterium]
MAADPRQFVVRRPRHEAVRNDACRAWLEFPHQDLPPVREVELVDLSRHGTQLRYARPIEPGASLCIRIHCDEENLDVALQGTVCWQRTFGPARWAAGFVFAEELSYELMGELFLSGILDMGSATS